MICPICNQAELKREPGHSKLGGWFVTADVLRCPHCGATADAIGDKLRFTHIPGRYAAFLGQALIGNHTPDDSKNLSRRAREALSRQKAILEGELGGCRAPIELRPTETCVYTVPQVTLEEQRTRQGQEYWGTKATGPLTVTEDNLYVADQATPIRKINGAILTGRSIQIARSDRKRATRITFSDNETAYFAALAMSRVVSVLEKPHLSDTPFQQKGLGSRLSIPIGKGKQQLVSLWAIPIALAVIACICPCSLIALGNLSSSTDTTPTEATSIPATLADRAPSASTELSEAETGSTSLPDPTDTRRPTDTATPTVTPLPTVTHTPQSSPTPERIEAQVTQVIDGDTIEVMVGGETYTVRYIGIDTPETVHPDQPVGWMGPEATAANEALVQGQTVYLEQDVSETDQYGRLLCYVWLVDGTLVNETLVLQGYASAVSYPPDVKYQERFQAAEEQARELAACRRKVLPCRPKS